MQATQELLGALQEADPDPSTVERLLRNTEEAYRKVRAMAEEQLPNSTSGGIHVRDASELRALLTLQAQCADRAREIRSLVAGKLEEVRAGREALQGYQRAAGAKVAPEPGFYDRRV